jgi:hypothetical protein
MCADIRESRPVIFDGVAEASAHPGVALEDLDDGEWNRHQRENDLVDGADNGVDRRALVVEQAGDLFDGVARVEIADAVAEIP